MPKGNTFEADMVKLIFTTTTIVNIAQNVAASPAATFYISLHTASVGEAGSQTTNEATYTGYARKGIARGAGFTVTAATATNAALLTFAACTGGTNNIGHFAVGMSASGAGKVLYYGATTATLQVTNGVAPQIAAGALDISEA